MSNSRIDADALIKWVETENYRTYDEDMMRDYGMVYTDELITKINELATPVPEPQESIGAIYDSTK